MRLLLPAALLALAACGETDTSLPGTCRGLVTYGVGSTATDTLGQNECARPGDVGGHLYRLSLHLHSNIGLTMTPTGFRGVLAVYDSLGTLVWSDNSEGAIAMKLYLPPGAYLAVAGRYGATGGPYTLTSAATAQLDCTPIGRTIRGASIAGSVTATDCLGALAYRYDTYGVRLTAGQVVTIVANTEATGRIEVIQDASNSVIDAQATVANTDRTIAFIVPATGVYRINVASQGFPNPYTLDIQ